LETQLEQADKTIRELRTRNNRLQLDSETLKVDLVIVTNLFCHFYRIFTHCQGNYRSVRYWFVLLLPYPDINFNPSVLHIPCCQSSESIPLANTPCTMSVSEKLLSQLFLYALMFLLHFLSFYLEHFEWCQWPFIVLRWHLQDSCVHPLL